MTAVWKTLGYGSRAASYVLGSLVLIGAIASFAVSSDTSVIAGWALDVLGVGFLGLLGGLVFASAVSFVRMTATDASDADAVFWLEVGVQAANGVTTLALTFHLVGHQLGDRRPGGTAADAGNRATDHSPVDRRFLARVHDHGRRSAGFRRPARGSVDYP